MQRLSYRETLRVTGGAEPSLGGFLAYLVTGYIKTDSGIWVKMR